MTNPTQKPFHLPWNQYDQYWICLWPVAEFGSTSLANDLTALGFQKRTADRDYYVCLAGKHWAKTWDKVRPLLEASASDSGVAVIAGDTEPDDKQIAFSHKPMDAVNDIVSSLWLGDAILREDVLCYLQPVMSTTSKVLGYESFARVKSEDDSIIGGFEIVQASRALGIEFALDRYLHVQAIKTYVGGDLNGFLFINFFPGFIQRPEVYLEGLSEAVRLYGIISKNVVLDFTESETEHDLTHLKRVTEYCRDTGYAIALDDVESYDSATRLIPEIKPDFVKLPRKMTSNYEKPDQLHAMNDIIGLARRSGSTIIAEGIETEGAFEKMKQLGADMFQGYLFSPPVEVKPDGLSTGT